MAKTVHRSSENKVPLKINWDKISYNRTAMDVVLTDEFCTAQKKHHYSPWI